MMMNGLLCLLLLNPMVKLACGLLFKKMLHLANLPEIAFFVNNFGSFETRIFFDLSKETLIRMKMELN